MLNQLAIVCRCNSVQTPAEIVQPVTVQLAAVSKSTNTSLLLNWGLFLAGDHLGEAEEELLSPESRYEAISL